MKSPLFFLSLAAALFSAQLEAQNEKKVMFIGIDGLRYDALVEANTPVIDSLKNVGLFTNDSWHLGITMSGPSWSSMLTGVWENKHLVTNNSYTNANYTNYPYFPKRAKECRPDLKCVQIITWNPMDDASNGTGGYVYNSGWDYSLDVGTHGQGLVTSAALTQMLDAELDVLFLHYDEVDVAGHANGFSPTVPTYMNAIEGVDIEIGQVMNGLRSRSNYANEDWLILLTTDHGGIGLGHGGNTNNERHIWWIASGPSVPNAEITGPDPGSYQLTGVNPVTLDNTPVLTDIAVTALDHLLDDNCNPETNATWNLDGKSWLDEGAYVEDKKDGFRFEVYPNPSQGKFTAVFESVKQDAAYSVYDQAGKMVMMGRASSPLMENNRIFFDLTGLEKGLYTIQIQNDGKSFSRRLIINQ